MNGNTKNYWQTTEDGSTTRVLGDNKWMTENPVKKSSENTITVSFKFEDSSYWPLTFPKNATLEEIYNTFQSTFREKRPDYYETPEILTWNGHIPTEEEINNWQRQIKPRLRIFGQDLRYVEKSSVTRLGSNATINVIFPQIGG